MGATLNRAQTVSSSDSGNEAQRSYCKSETLETMRRSDLAPR